MKRISCIFCIIFILLVNTVFADDDWTQKSPTTKPNGRSAHAMSYIISDHVLLFGGSSGVALNDTWIYDLSGNTWTNKDPDDPPATRYYHAISYIGDDQVLLFAGNNNGSFLSDTWIYDLSGNTWTNKNPSGDKPSARFGHTMSYIGGDQVLLFGGYDDTYHYKSDTWVYDLSENKWTNKDPSAPPSARSYHTMSNLGGDQVIIFGGEGPSKFNDTWLYDLSENTWTNKDPDDPPSARCYHTTSYIGGDQMLLFGGHDGSSVLNDTWVYDLSDNAWTQDLNTTQPSARSGCVLSETSLDALSYLVLFGGSGYNDETWTFGGGDYSLPVTLSAFTAQFIENTPTIYWSTQSEIDNMGWLLYRNSENDFTTSEVISDMIEGHGTTTQQSNYVYEDNLQDAEIDSIYYYWLESVDYSGMIHHYYKVAILTIPENSDPGNIIVPEPEKFGLFQNSPNPVASSTIISFNLIEADNVDLTIYNLKGQRVIKLYSGNTSKHTVMWDGKDENGKELENGVYFYKLNINGKTEEIKKLILMR